MLSTPATELQSSAPTKAYRPLPFPPCLGRKAGSVGTTRQLCGLAIPALLDMEAHRFFQAFLLDVFLAKCCMDKNLICSHVVVVLVVVMVMVVLVLVVVMVRVLVVVLVVVW